MPGKATVLVPRREMDDIFRALDILTKIDDGRLTTRKKDPDPSTAFQGGTSFICLHTWPEGIHVATTHEVYDAQGDLRHRHGKDIRLGDIKFYTQER